MKVMKEISSVFIMAGVIAMALVALGVIVSTIVQTVVFIEEYSGRTLP